MVEPQIVQAGILVSLGIVVAIILIFFGFILGRKTQGETSFSIPSAFKPDEKAPEEDVFAKALLSPEEGGYSDGELEEMNRARPYEGS